MARITPREAIIGGLCALAYPIGCHIAARLAHRHYLDIKETP